LYSHFISSTSSHYLLISHFVLSLHQLYPYSSNQPLCIPISSALPSTHYLLISIFAYSLHQLPSSHSSLYAFLFHHFYSHLSIYLSACIFHQLSPPLIICLPARVYFHVIRSTLLSLSAYQPVCLTYPSALPSFHYCICLS
jgi:hypothetical protein